MNWHGATIEIDSLLPKREYLKEKWSNLSFRHQSRNLRHPSHDLGGFELEVYSGAYDQIFLGLDKAVLMEAVLRVRIKGSTVEVKVAFFDKMPSDPAKIYEDLVAQAKWQKEGNRPFTPLQRILLRGMGKFSIDSIRTRKITNRPSRRL